MRSQGITARTYGIFFLRVFVSYGLGSGLVESTTGTTDSLISINANK